MLKAKELKSKREALKLSQQQIAKELGVSQNTVSRIELGLNDRLTLHIAYNGLLNELEQGIIDTVELANDWGITVPEAEQEIYNKLIEEGVKNE